MSMPSRRSQNSQPKTATFHHRTPRSVFPDRQTSDGRRSHSSHQLLFAKRSGFRHPYHGWSPRLPAPDCAGRTRPHVLPTEGMTPPIIWTSSTQGSAIRFEKFRSSATLRSSRACFARSRSLVSQHREPFFRRRRRRATIGQVVTMGLAVMPSGVGYQRHRLRPDCCRADPCLRAPRRIGFPLGPGAKSNRLRK